MRKNITKILLLILVFTAFTLSGCSSEKETPTANIQPEHFVSHFAGTHFVSSKIFTDCRKDSDCKIEYLSSGCSTYKAININNTQKDIDDYYKKENTLGILVECAYDRYEEKDYKAVCSNNVCRAKVKTIPKLLNFITTKHSLADIEYYFNSLLLNL